MGLGDILTGTKSWLQEHGVPMGSGGGGGLGAYVSQPTAPPPITPVPQPVQRLPPQQPATIPSGLGTVIRPASMSRVPGPRTITTEGPSPASMEIGHERFAEGGSYQKFQEAQLAEKQREIELLKEMQFVNDEKTRVMEDHTARVADLNARRQSAAMEFDAEQKQALEDINSMETEDFWGKQDTGTKILAAIGMALGAYGSALTGAPNTAMQIINDAINRDMQLQKDRINKQRTRLQDLRGGYAIIKDNLDDDLRSEALYHAAATDRVLSIIDGLQANAKTEMMKQKIETIKAGFEDQRMQEQQQLAALNQQRVTQSEQIVTTPAVTVGDAMGLAPYDKDTFVPFLQANARGNASQVKETMQFANASNELLQVYDEMLKIRDKPMNLMLPWVKKNMQRLNKAATILQKNKENMGANFTEMEAKLVSVKNPEDITSFMAGTDLRQMRDNLIRSIETKKQDMTYPTNPETIPYAERRENPLEKYTLKELEQK